jgi:hypothetical protein
MHNCKLTKDNLPELALHELTLEQERTLVGQLDHCASCREEYAAIKESLSMTRASRLAQLPAENFWSGYHERLAHRLQSPTINEPQLTATERMWQTLKTWATSSVRIPIPVAAAVLVIFAAAITTFSLRTTTKVIEVPASSSPSIVTEVIRIPVPEEKLITRVVYVEKTRFRNRQRMPLGFDTRNIAADQSQSTTDSSQKPSMSLVGFKPTEQVKIHVLKGSYRDEQ